MTLTELKIKASTRLHYFLEGIRENNTFAFSPSRDCPLLGSLISHPLPSSKLAMVDQALLRLPPLFLHF